VSTAPEHLSLRFPAVLGSSELLLRRPRSGTSIHEELESEGPLRKESVTHRNSARDSLQVFQIAKVFYANLTPRARSACIGLTRAKLSPLLLMLFLFLFYQT
jgi:hypothetical protein